MKRQRLVLAHQCRRNLHQERDLVHRVPIPRVEELAQPFSAPVLFLLGRQDSIVGYQDAWRIIENYPHASFVILDRAGHCLQMEQRKLYETLVHEWLDRVEEYMAKGADRDS